MTDPSGLTPEQEAVRRLLADARHDGPTPPEVVARLDDALASLVSERGDAPLPRDEHDEPLTTRAPVVDLGARRRRLVGMGVLAAAAVVVAGVAVGQGLPRLSGGDSDSGSADVATSESRDFADDSGGEAGAGDGSSGQEMAPQTKQDPTDVPTLSTFDAELEQHLAHLRSGAAYQADALGSARAQGSCELRGIGPGRRVVAQVDGQAGVVVFRRPSGDAQDVAIYVCGSTVPVRTLTLPAP